MFELGLPIGIIVLCLCVVLYRIGNDPLGPGEFYDD
jgi:hypothetical protein